MGLMRLAGRLRALSPSAVDRALQITNNTVQDDSEFLDVYWALVREGRMLLTFREAHNIRRYLTASENLGGAVAELGVYRGGGAKLICEFKSDAPLHLFDTFVGMPEVNSAVDLHGAGDFGDSSLESVEDYLRGYPNVHFHAGFFPDTTVGPPDDIEFRFVHLDADLYESTLAGLNYFHPRLRQGGYLISHDYGASSCPGVKRAFDEFFAGSSADVVPLWDTQAMVVKRG
jgi:O-methyltransferase